ncbi:MAG TPA: hypothetical protein VFS35_10225, partial [Terrimicrobiaceae bacterium]|nr:hypothetical protein [Terrimicrobiaceae bacterium]
VEDREVFASGQTIVSIGDVIRAAYFRGELQPHWERVWASAEDDENAAELDQAELQARSEEYRIDHDLISAEETERWLSERSLTTEDFHDFLVRRWRQEITADSPHQNQAIDFAFASPELRELLRVDLLFSDAFDVLATQLAWRFAAREADVEVANEEEIRVERDAFFERAGVTAATLPVWFNGLGTNDAWLDEMLELEAVFRRGVTRQLTSSARERMARSLRVSLTRFELELIELHCRDAAREALECVSLDGESMEDVAGDAGFPFWRLTVLHDELPEELRRTLLCALPGEILPPLESDGRFRLYRLLGKTECDLTDDAMRRRIDSEIIERHFADLTTRFVRWILPAGHVP